MRVSINRHSWIHAVVWAPQTLKFFVLLFFNQRFWLLTTRLDFCYFSQLDFNFLDGGHNSSWTERIWFFFWVFSVQSSATNSKWFAIWNKSSWVWSHFSEFSAGTGMNFVSQAGGVKIFLKNGFLLLDNFSFAVEQSTLPLFDFLEDDFSIIDIGFTFFQVTFFLSF